MAAYSVATGERGAYAKTLVASTVDTVTFTRHRDRLEVFSDGAAAVYFTVNGSAPTVGAAGTYEIPAASGGAVRVVSVPKPARTPDVAAADETVVRLISSGTPKYSVSEA